MKEDPSIDKIPKDYNKLLDEVFLCREKKQYEKGLSILLSLAKEHKNDKVISGLTATVYYEKGDFKKSMSSFKKSTLLNPGSELASLGYYHSLVSLGKTMPALIELRRFVSSNKYDAYSITIKELKENLLNFNKDEQEIIQSLPE